MAMTAVRHSLVYDSQTYFFDSLSFEKNGEVYQTPTLSNGYYTKPTGIKNRSIIISGKVCQADKSIMTALINKLNGTEVSIVVDSTSYSKVVMTQSVLTFSPDSRIGSFKIVFRRVD